MAATLLTCVQILRQLRDVAATTDASGVSSQTWILALVQSAGIGIFSGARGLPEATAANALVGALCLAVLWELGRKRHQPLLPLSGVTVVLVCLLIALAAGPAAIGTIGAVASAVVWIPQAARSYRTGASGGLSLPFVLAGVSSSALWLLYGALVEEWRLLIPPSAAIVSMGITYAFAVRDD